MSEKFVSAWFYAGLDSSTRPAGFFGTKTEKVYHERNADLNEYANLLRETYENFDSAGYDVVNVVPIAMGQSEQCNRKNGEFVGEVGFSITRGAVVIGKKRD